MNSVLSPIRHFGHGSKTIVRICLLISILAGGDLALAQEFWSGNKATNSTIHRLGRVAIGTPHTSNRVLEVYTPTMGYPVSIRSGSIRSGLGFESSTGTGYIYTQGDGLFLSHKVNGKDFIIRNSGNVGVGTDSPQYKLAVNGTVGAREVIVTNAAWPDFVFAEEYELMPLDDVEEAIGVQGHLPGVPSAREVVEDGIALGEMQAILLQKVEELTLYMIELKKDNDELRSQIQELTTAN